MFVIKWNLLWRDQKFRLKRFWVSISIYVREMNASSNIFVLPLSHKVCFWWILPSCETRVAESNDLNKFVALAKKKRKNVRESNNTKQVIVDCLPLPKMFILTIWKLCIEPKARYIVKIVKINILDRAIFICRRSEVTFYVCATNLN